MQLDAFPGIDRDTDPLDSVFLDAPQPRTVEQAVSFVRRNTSNPMRVKGLKRQGTGTYPTEALREVIVNAVARRDYADLGAKISVEVFADRFRVSSPGLPPGGQSVERLASGQAPSRARNPLVVQGLSWLELMDERGSGIRRMTRLLEQAGHPKPAFRIDHDSLVVEFRPLEAALKAVSNDREIVEAGMKAQNYPRGRRSCGKSRRQGRFPPRCAFSGWASPVPPPNALSRIW